MNHAFRSRTPHSEVLGSMMARNDSRISYGRDASMVGNNGVQTYLPITNLDNSVSSSNTLLWVGAAALAVYLIYGQ